MVCYLYYKKERDVQNFFWKQQRCSQKKRSVSPTDLKPVGLVLTLGKPTSWVLAAYISEAVTCQPQGAILVEKRVGVWLIGSTDLLVVPCSAESNRW